MEIENKIKAMGLELPAVGTPPAGRAGAALYRSMGRLSGGRGLGRASTLATRTRSYQR